MFVTCYSSFSQARSPQSLEDTRRRTGTRKRFCRQRTAFFMQIFYNKLQHTNNNDLILAFPTSGSGRGELWRAFLEEDSLLLVKTEAPAGFPGSPRWRLGTSAPAAAPRLSVLQQDKTGRKLLGFNQFSLFYLSVVHPLSTDSASARNKGCNLLTKEMLSTPR